MRERLSKILITGAAGFMGSAFARRVINRKLRVCVIDNLTYAGDLARLKEIRGGFTFYKADIVDYRKLKYIFKKEKPDAVVNYSAETHVDKSIQNPAPFIKTNILGTQNLLDISREFRIRIFLQLSTDEVYGEIKKGNFIEGSPLTPNSPYAASKAAADLLIKSYMRTYKFPAIIIRPCNNYGPWQCPEKLIPLAILKILKKQKIPVYGAGNNIREWLYVEDCAEGVLRILKNGRIGEVYNLGSNQEMQNLEIVGMILKILGAPKSLIQFVKDRPGHDIRYSLNSRKVSDHVGWQPQTDFKQGLKNTVHWYLRNKKWLFGKWKDITALYKCGR